MITVINTWSNQNIGTGNLVRQKLISVELEKRGHRALFFMRDTKESRKLSEKFSLNSFFYSANLQADKEARLIAGKCLNLEADVLIMDSLNNTGNFVNKIRSAPVKIVAFDNYGSGVWSSDLSINAILPPKTKRPTWSKTKLLTGLEYIILKKPVVRRQKIRDKVKRVFISQGGTDTFGLLPKIVEILGSIKAPIKFDVHVGPIFKHDKSLNAALKKTSANFVVFDNVRNLAKLMRGADMAISACGLTIFELLSIGIPTLALTAEPRERDILEKLAEIKVVKNLGYYQQGKKLSIDIVDQVKTLIDNAEKRQMLSVQASKLFSKNRGLEMVCDNIVQLA